MNENNPFEQILFFYYYSPFSCLRPLLATDARLLGPADEYRGKLTADDVIALCKEHLPHYAIPKYVEFKDDLPVTVTMKLFKKELREEAIAKLKEKGEMA